MPSWRIAVHSIVVMADDDTPSDPLGGLPFFGDLSKLFAASGGGVPWDAARQLAIGVATGGTSEPNVDPVERQALAELSRIAELHVARASRLTVAHASGSPVLVPMTRAQWAAQTLADYRGYLSALGGHLAGGPAAEPAPDEPADPVSQLFGGLMKMIGPSMAAMTAGSLVGQLAQRSLGAYDMPLPRGEVSEHRTEIPVVAPNLATFAREWSLPGEDLRLWVCLHELTLHTVLGLPHVHSRMAGLVTEFVEGFRTGDPTVLEGRLGELELSPEAQPEDVQRQLQSVFGDPEVLLGAIRSPGQDATQQRLQALVDVLVGFVDHVIDEAGEGLIASQRQLCEALRRRRVTAGVADTFTERLLGLELSHSSVERGQSFVAGVLERAGELGLDRLWSSEDSLPTPNEVDAPGLWLARIEYE